MERDKKKIPTDMTYISKILQYIKKMKRIEEVVVFTIC